MVQERREWPRVKVELPCDVQLLIADRNFEPHSTTGCILDLAVRGVKVRIPHLPKGIFRKILQSSRQARLTFSPPASEVDIRVIGTIIWMNFKNDEELLDLVLYFQNVAPEAERVLESIVEKGS
jgi:hypothetical protein